MSMYYSPTTLGFYCDDVHGPRMLLVHDETQPDDPHAMVEVPNPGCLIPVDAVEITQQEHAALMAAQAAGAVILPGQDGRPEAAPPSPPSDDEQRQRLMRSAQIHLDAQAQSMGYDSIFTAVTYAEEPAVPQYQAEGQALRAWRSLVWSACISMLDAMPQGEAFPSEEQLIAALPPYQP